jgi:hypothetical protein
MSNLKDNLLAVFGAVLATVVGRAIAYLLVSIGGMAAAEATALHHSVSFSEVLLEALPMAFSWFTLPWWGFLLAGGMVIFFFLFLRTDIHWAFLLIPFLVAWLLTHYALAPHPLYLPFEGMHIVGPLR